MRVTAKVTETVSQQLKVWIRDVPVGSEFHDICYQLVFDEVMKETRPEDFRMSSQLAGIITDVGQAYGYTPPTLADFKLDALEGVKAHHATVLGSLTGGYSNEERDTWPMQLGWAEAYTNSGDAKAAQLLSDMLPTAVVAQLTASGQHPASYMASKIIAKAGTAARLTVDANRIKTEVSLAINAATTVAELNEVIRAAQAAEGVTVQALAAMVDNAQ